MTDVVQWKLNQKLAIEEVLSFPVSLLAQLPRPPVLVLKTERPGFVALDFREHSKTKTTDELVVFNVGEIEALVEAAENDRIFERDFLGFCDIKARNPVWRLTREIALGSVPGILSKPPESRRWTTARFLERIGARLQSVRV